MPTIIAKPYWYLRHGETDWNRRGLSQGSTDVPLNETGLAQAQRAGRGLAALFAQGGSPFDVIVSSPLSRALVTAEFARDAIRGIGGTALEILTDDDLREVSFGVREGQPMGDWYDPWIEEGYTPQGGESFAALRARAVRAVNRALSAGKRPLFVAHGALFRGMRAGMGLEINVRLPNAVPLHVAPEEGGWEIRPMDLAALDLEGA